MLTRFLSSIWRRTPVLLKRKFLTFTNTRFAVTVGAIISDGNGRVLLLKHRFRPGSGWGMPGGYMSTDEQPEAALRRELREEIGIELDKIELHTARAFTKPSQVEIVFRCAAVGEPGQLNYEIEKAEWFSPGEMPPQLPKDQMQLIRDAFADGANEIGLLYAVPRNKEVMNDRNE